MHERLALPKPNYAERAGKYSYRNGWERLAVSLLSRLVKWSKVQGHPRRPWVAYRVVMGLVRLYYRVFHRLEVRGRHLVPRAGAIFVVNHLAGADVVVPFLAAFREPVGAFTEAGDGYLADVLEELFGFVTRRGVVQEMVEKMVRAVLLRNRYFVMWPEGTLERQGKVMQGFSGIVRVYATLNAERDVVPFVPVAMQRGERRGRLSKVRFTFLEPFFVPRQWLKHPSEGGRTPREIIDEVMLRLARVFGQRELWPNPALERRRAARNRQWH
ncbi:MAG: hypothetical protein Kow0069_26720 [Promethearchaeota archaeon]